MTTAQAFVSDFVPITERYLALKQALGRQYATERNVLADLDRFLASQTSGATDLTAKAFAAWTATLVHLTPTVRRNRMRIVRNFCLYRQRNEPGCFVPDLSTFPRPHVPQRPHLFTEHEIVQLLRVVEDLQPSPTSPLRRDVYRLAVVLLFTCGLRRGELVRLTLADYDPAERILKICSTKFHKSRIVPLSCDAVDELADYLQARRTLAHPLDSPLLCNRRGGLRQYTGHGLAQGLRSLFRSAGVKTAEGRLPRVHDLRHSFAVHALLRWYQDGVDVQEKLPALATYMGHVSIVSTQYYLGFLEPFAETASQLFARHCAPILRTSPTGGGTP